jgi:UDP-GlcNAc:undecaprenyl-phosphate GlcNAc-1-phosphate transferase
VKSFLAAFIFAVAASLLLTPLVRSIAMARGFVARTSGRHIHAGRIPRTGGIALAVGWCLSLLAFLPLEGLGTETLERSKGELAGILGGAMILCAVGAVDDIRGMRMHHKLAGQVLVALLAYSCGIRIEAILLPFVGVLSMGAFALPVTVLWIVGITNAVNLIDGLDGLAAGVSLFAAATGLIVAVLNGSLLVAMMLSALVGVLAGFLFYNFNPARIFMGDSGSYFLGYVLATTSLAGGIQQKTSTAVSLLIPIIALGLPIFDTLFSMIRRFVERRPILTADRGHIHHRLIDLGLTQRRAVMLLYAVSVAFAACAVLMSLGGNWAAGSAIVAASVVLICLMRLTGYFDYLHRRGRNDARIYDALTERLRRATPELLAALQSADAEAETFRVLRRSLGDTGCTAIELRAGGEVVQRFPEGPAESGSSIRRSYPLGGDGAARAQIDFLWHVEEGDPTPQASILLQVLADGVARALARAESALSPLVVEPEPLLSEPPPRTAVVAVSGTGRV